VSPARRWRLPLPRLPLQLWLFGSYVLVLSLPVLAVLGTGALAWDLVNQTREDLEHQGALIAMVAADRMHGRPEGISELLAAAKAQTLAGIRIVNDAGVVVASSGKTVGEDLSDDEEVRTALAGSQGLAIKPREPVPLTRRTDLASRESKSRHADVRVFVAVPIVKDGTVLGAVVLSRTPREEWQTFWQMAPRLTAGALLALALTSMLSVFAGWRAARSLRLLAAASERIAAGQLGDDATFAEAQDSRIRETSLLASAMALMASRLRARLAYISEFAGNVSHEFKTPVSSLRGTVELLRDDEQMSPEQRARFLDNALADLDRLSNLVGGLLRLARAEEGGPHEPVDLDALTDELARRHPAVKVDGEAGTVSGGPEQLGAMVANLLQNALRHGGPNVRLTRWRGLEGGVGVAGVTVQDDGPGIPAAHLPRLFDRFYTTDRARGGTGLGLALVKAIAEAHQGGVDVSSEPGRTVFRAWVRVGG
jgi:signal transduction histidine kinase